MKIYINEKEIETNKTYLKKMDFLTLNGDKSILPEYKKYNVMKQVSDKYWEDESIFDNDEDSIEIKEGELYKVFPKASTSNYGPFV